MSKTTPKPDRILPSLLDHYKRTPRPDRILPSLLDHYKSYGKWRITTRDASLYALSVGFNLDPLNTKDFKYTFEKNKDFTILPIQVSTLAHFEQTQELLNNENLPVYHVYTYFHIEENYFMVHDKIETDTDYEITSECIDCIDKGPDKGCIIVFRISGYKINEKGERDLAFYSIRVTLQRALGGLGIKSTGKYKIYQKRPQRKPDLVIKDGLFSNQVFFYRLNNAPNPIHVDPALSMQFGYPKPMVHGMLSYTTITRVILQHVLDYDQKKIKAIQCRFTGLVFIEDKFQIKLWKQGSKIFFEIDVPERDVNVALGIVHVKEDAKL